MKWLKIPKYLIAFSILLYFVLVFEGWVNQHEPIEPSTDSQTSPNLQAPPNQTPLDPSQNVKSQGQKLAESLKQGGYVIYLHFVFQDNSTSRGKHLVLNDCNSQASSLSDFGKAQAETVEGALKMLQIPVSRVLSSEICLVAEAAKTAFEQAEPTSNLNSLILANAPTREQRIESLKEMLSTKPSAGTNIVLIGHLSNLRATTNITLPRGTHAIFEPLGEQGYKLVAELTDEWISFAREVARSNINPLPVEAKPPEMREVAHAPKSVLLLPDLQIMPPDELYIDYNQTTGRKVMRFSTTITNIGQGPLEMWGRYDTATGKTHATQRIQTQDGQVVEKFVGHFIFHSGHAHWHFENFTVFELWSYSPDDGTLERLLATTGKASFCVTDTARLQQELPGTPSQAMFPTCHPNVQGISVGWRDTYYSTVPGQHIDITNVPDGFYAVRSLVDPDNLLLETDKANNAIIVYVEISGNNVRKLSDHNLA